jgi:transcriptional regulator with XRE-family HTH domain
MVNHKRGDPWPMSTLQAFLSTVVEDELQQRRWTQAQLAEMAGISPSHLSGMLKGKTRGDIAVWSNLLHILDVDLRVQETSRGRRVSAM